MPTARHRRAPRRLLIAGLAALLTTSGALTVTGQPASAVVNAVQPVEVAWTDATQPTRSFPTDDGVLPVGSWRGAAGEKHRSRAYFTFDLTGYHGHRIIDARAITGERTVVDCTKPRDLQLWRTDTPTGAPTWKKAPAARELVANLGTSVGACPASYLSTLVTDAVGRAVAAQRNKITFMLRVGEHEADVRYGRHVETLGIDLKNNRAPDVPGMLSAGGVACRDDLYIGTTRPELQAQLTDPDVNDTGTSDEVKATFAWWPVDRPAERAEFVFSYTMHSPYRFRYTVPDGVIMDGGRYAFAVRATDQEGDSSEWSPECRFTVDTRRPAEPIVMSTDYPAVPYQPVAFGPGIAGRFTFSANGADDVKGYRYSGEDGIEYVDADTLGGSATVTYTPRRAGRHQLDVYSIDRTGNRSAVHIYEFYVRQTAPRVTDGNPDGAIGEPRELTFTPGMADVVQYTWQLNDGAASTVQAAADGTATVTITPRRGGTNRVTVTSRTSDGLPSGVGELQFYLATMPILSSQEYPLDGGDGAIAGTPGTFTFAPGMPGVTEYVWSTNGGAQRTVAAQADGSASVVFTPTEAGFQWIEVFSRTADGIESETASGYFVVFSHAPEVASADYPTYSESGGPGVAGEFTFRPAREGVTGYVYTFGDEERTVDALADGTAMINWTPRSYPADSSGWVRLRVREKIGTIVSDESEYTFIIGRLAPTVTSSDYPSSGSAGAPGVAGSFTLTAHVAGTTTFVYRYGAEEKTVEAGADGTAVVTLTPTEAGDNYLHVSSRTATGITSGEGTYWFSVNNPS
ncbi:hypothetical protein AB0J89_19100 [Micromonospora chokoriensis]